MDTILLSIIKKEEDQSIKLVEDLFLNQISYLSTAASLNQTNVVICLLKYTKVNCSTFLMNELITKELFEMASLFIINKRVTPAALKNFYSTEKYKNLDKFLDYLVQKNIKLNYNLHQESNDDICHSKFYFNNNIKNKNDWDGDGELYFVGREAEDNEPKTY